MTILNTAILIFGFINLFRLSIFTTATVIYDKVFKKKRRDYSKQHLTKDGTRSYYKYCPFISVLVPAYNEEKVMKRTLEHIFKSTYKNFEVIVINDGSADKTEEIVLEFKKTNPNQKLTYVYQTNQGKAHALNNALFNHAKGKLFMSLDADSVLSPDAMEEGVKYFKDRKVKALAANVKIIPDKSVFGLIQRLEYIMGHHLKKALTVGNIEYIIGGVGSIFRTKYVKKLGGYDTDTITEDIDLTMKIVGQGNKKHRIIYAEDVVAHTESVIDPRSLFKQRFRWKFGRFQTFWKNKSLFFNRDQNYTKLLTFVYLPFQLFTEFMFLLDPLFIGYILYWAISHLDPSSFYNIILFTMVFTVFGIARDKETPVLDRIKLMLISPLAYIFFLLISMIEYLGLIKCILKWKEIIYLNKYKKCHWTPVERKG